MILIHASLRLRSMKNKLENKIEGAGLKKTPMGVIMDLLDQQEEKINKIQDFIESKLKDWETRRDDDGGVSPPDPILISHR